MAAYDADRIARITTLAYVGVGDPQADVRYLLQVISEQREAASSRFTLGELAEHLRAEAPNAATSSRDFGRGYSHCISVLEEYRAEMRCGDWPAPCNCNDPETHDGH